MGNEEISTRAKGRMEFYLYSIVQNKSNKRLFCQDKIKDKMLREDRAGGLDRI